MFDLDEKFTQTLKQMLKKEQKLLANVVTIRYLLQVHTFSPPNRASAHDFPFQNEAITEDEADAIFATEFYVKNLDNNVLKFRYSNDIRPRRILVAHLYAKMCRWIYHGLEVCGLYCFTVRNTQLHQFDRFHYFDLFTGFHHVRCELFPHANERIRCEPKGSNYASIGGESEISFGL